MAGLGYVLPDSLPQSSTFLTKVISQPIWLSTSAQQQGRDKKNNNNIGATRKSLLKKGQGKKTRPKKDLFLLLSECLAQDIVIRRVFEDESWPVHRRVAIRGVCKQWKKWVDDKVSAISPSQLSDSVVFKLSKAFPSVSSVDLTSLREHKTVAPEHKHSHQQFCSNYRSHHNFSSRNQMSINTNDDRIEGWAFGLLRFFQQLKYITLSVDRLVRISDLGNLRLLPSQRITLKLMGVNQNNYSEVLATVSKLRSFQSLEMVAMFGFQSCIQFLQSVNESIPRVALDLTLIDVMCDEFNQNFELQTILLNLLCQVNHLVKLTDATHRSWLQLRFASQVVLFNPEIQCLTLGKNWLGSTPQEQIDSLDEQQLQALQQVPNIQMGTQLIDHYYVSHILQQRLQLCNITKLSSGGNVSQWVDSPSVKNLRSLSLIADGAFVKQAASFSQIAQLQQLTSLDIQLHFWGSYCDDKQATAFVTDLFRTISTMGSLENLTVTKMRFDRVREAETKVLAPLRFLRKLKSLALLNFSGVLQGEKLGYFVVGRLHSLIELQLVAGKPSSGVPGGVVTIEGEINSLLSARKSRSLRDSRIRTLTVWPLLHRVDVLISLAHLANVAHLKVGFVGRGHSLKPNQEVLDYVRSSLAGLRNLHIEFISDTVL